MPLERLQKVLAAGGLGSRRSCEALIEAGRVRVNNQVASLGQKVIPGQGRIEVDGVLLKSSQPLTYIALHKPPGVVSSLAPQGLRQTVVDLVPLDVRLYPVGRLDLESEGLLVLTNDGELTDYLTHPRYGVEREYRVLVRGEPTVDRLAAWRRGVVLEGRRTLPAGVRREAHTPAGFWLRVIMHEGRKHEIRDIGRALGLPVVRLIRMRIGSLHLSQLQPGQWRRLSPAEVAHLKSSGSSSGASPRSRPGRRAESSVKPRRPRPSGAPRASARPAGRRTKNHT